MTAPRSRREFVAVAAVTAVLTFLMAAAASAIVADAGGAGARELAYSANSIVFAGEGDDLSDVPGGARVPVLVPVDAAVLADGGAPEVPSAPGGVRLTVVGVISSPAAGTAEMFASHANAWSAVEDRPAVRLRNSAIDVGARLRKAGMHAVVLPDGFLGASAGGCTVADGLYRGGVIPVFRVAPTPPAAVRRCLAHFTSRDPSVYADLAGGRMPSVPHGVTLFLETQAGTGSQVLRRGATFLLVTDRGRTETIESLVASRSAATQAAVVDAARRASSWYAGVPPAGSVPSKTPPQAPAKKRGGVKLDKPEKIGRRSAGANDAAPGQEQKSSGSGGSGAPPRGSGGGGLSQR